MGPKLAQKLQKLAILLFIGSDYLLEAQFLAIFGQYFSSTILAP